MAVWTQETEVAPLVVIPVPIDVVKVERQWLVVPPGWHLAHLIFVWRSFFKHPSLDRFLVCKLMVLF